MAKIIRKKKQRHLRVQSIVSLMFVVSLLSWLGTQTFLKTIQVNYLVKTQELQTQIADLENENSTIAIKIQALQRGDRISAAVAGDDLKSYSNITQITKGE